LGIFLSGSRSILFPIAGLGIFIVITHFQTLSKDLKKKILKWTPAVIFGIVVASFLFNMQTGYFENFYTRYVEETMNNPTSDRAGQWSGTIEAITTQDFPTTIRMIFLGIPEWGNRGEGLLGFGLTKGFIPLISLYLCMILPMVQLWKTKEVRPLVFGLICILFQFTIDSTPYYPPSEMNYFLFVAIGLKLQSAFQKSRQTSKAFVPSA
jgi:O-antigen ligase